MRELLVGLVGESLAPIAAMILAGVVVLILVLALLALLRRVGSGRLGIGGRGTPQPRVALLDVVQVDPKRRLVLVRRDEVEHLLMIGGPNDFVVEPQIQRTPATGGRREGAPRADPNFGGAQPAMQQPSVPQPVPVAQRPRAAEPAVASSPAVVASPPVAAPSRAPAASAVSAAQRAPTGVMEPRRAPDPVRAPEPVRPPSPARVEPAAARPEMRLPDDGGRRIEPSFPEASRPVAEPERPPVAAPPVGFPEPRRESVPSTQPSPIVAEPRVMAPRPPVQPMPRTNPVPAEQPTRGEPSFDFVPAPASAPREAVKLPQNTDAVSVQPAPREDDAIVRQPLSVRSFASSIQNRRVEPAPRPVQAPAEPVPVRDASAQDEVRAAPAAPAVHEADDDGLAALLQEEFTPRTAVSAEPEVRTDERASDSRSLEDEMERLLRDFTTDASTRR